MACPMVCAIVAACPGVTTDPQPEMLVKFVIPVSQGISDLVYKGKLAA